MNFFANLASFGTTSAKPKTTPAKRPVNVAFCQQIVKQMDHLLGNALLKPRAVWSTVHADGTVSVQLKNGVTPIPLGNGVDMLTTDGVNAAIEFLAAAFSAAQVGEFDAVLAQTKGKKSKKEVL